METSYPNWFAAYADGFFERHLGGKSGLRCLQLGAFTGDASLWLLDNIPGVSVEDVDTWEGSDEPEHEPFDWPDVESVYDEKVAGRTSKVKASSGDYFQDLRYAWLDFIYIDGDHTAAGVLSDAVHAFDILKVGGLMAFDDYQWKPYPDAPPHLAPAMAIDTFTACYQDRLNILEAGLQVWIRKTA